MSGDESSAGTDQSPFSGAIRTPYWDVMGAFVLVLVVLPMMALHHRLKEVFARD